MSTRDSRWPAVIGHEWALDQIAGALANGRLSHAYLFTGVAHVGKTTVARTVAQMLNRDQPADPRAPCLTCRACRLIAADTHPDVRLVEPTLSSSGRSSTLRIDRSAPFNASCR